MYVKHILFQQIVMENQTDIGNCLLWNSKRILTSDDERDNIGMKTFSPMLLPDITFALSTNFPFSVSLTLYFSTIYDQWHLQPKKLHYLLHKQKRNKYV